jgi:hypothetical protein
MAYLCQITLLLPHEEENGGIDALQNRSYNLEEAVARGWKWCCNKWYLAKSVGWQCYMPYGFRCCMER